MVLFEIYFCFLVIDLGLKYVKDINLNFVKGRRLECVFIVDVCLFGNY